MSDYRAIAAASRTLRTLLRDRMDPEFPVSLAPPDISTDVVPGPRLNLYLFRVAENAALKNQESPRLPHLPPPLSLDLFYLMTAYPQTPTADDADLSAQEMLGNAMRVFHEFALITPQLTIVRATTPGGVGSPILDPALRNEFERVKLTLHPMTMDDFSKIWTALPQSNFRRSVVYQACVVQIESRRPRHVGPPVTTRRVHLALLERPEITAVYRTPAANEPPGDARAGIGQQITIEGHHFAGARTWVRFGEQEPIRVQPTLDPDRPIERITIAIPDDQYPIDADHPVARAIPAPDQLRPGPQTVEVLTEQETEVVEGALGHGATVFDQRTVQSNQGVFMLVPQIAAVDPTDGPSGTVVRVTGSRLFDPSRPSSVVVGHRTFQPLDPAAATSPAGTVRSATEVWVRVEGLTQGEYRVRARVSGAQSVRDDVTFEVTP